VLQGVRDWWLLRDRRWLVTSAGVIAIAFFAGGLLSSESIFRSFVMGGVSALIVMGVGGLAEGLWRGGEVEEVEGGGWRVRLARATLRPLRVLERRVDSQMEQINDRLFDLERAVFKDRMGRSEQERE
jgi:hypothetical protein